MQLRAVGVELPSELLDAAWSGNLLKSPAWA
jgi:hypothetical protein